MQRYWGRIKTLQFSQGWEQSNVLMEINCLEYYFNSRWLIEKNCIRSNCKASVNEPKFLFTLQDSSFFSLSSLGRILSLCYCWSTNRKEWCQSEKRVRKSCHCSCLPEILCLPQSFLWDWGNTSPPQFDPMRCHTSSNSLVNPCNLLLP